MNIKVRFAPSPTGNMHVGNARIALLNHLFARRHGGSLLLRIDDTDRERSRTIFETGLVEDLAWLGIRHDSFLRQSERLPLYGAALDRLRSAGLLYPCYETPDELAARRQQLLRRGLPPVYDRAALALTAADRQALEKAGRRPHWRLRLPDSETTWDDLGCGPVRFMPGHLSDPVLVREDGQPLYTLSSVVDDGDCGISHIIRGADHIANTAVQLALFAALALPLPRFAHLPLLHGADGRPLSKRLDSLSVRQLRADGVEARALLLYLAGLGRGDGPDPEADPDLLAAGFDLGGYGRASPRYDPAELQLLNSRVLARQPFAAVQPRLRASGLDGAGEDFWMAVRENIATLEEAGYWWQVCRGSIETMRPAEDQPFLTQAAMLLPDDPAGDAYNLCIAACKQASGRKGRALFHPLRLALTGRAAGPELSALFPLMDMRIIARRLSGETGNPPSE